MEPLPTKTIPILAPAGRQKKPSTIINIALRSHVFGSDGLRRQPNKERTHYMLCRQIIQHHALDVQKSHSDDERWIYNWYPKNRTKRQIYS